MKLLLKLVFILTINNLYSASPYVDNQLIVKFSSGLDEKNISQKLEKTDFILKQILVKKLNIWLIELNSKNKTIFEHLEEISNFDFVDYVQLDHKVSQREIPNDPYFNQMWGLNNTGQNGGQFDGDIDAEEAWDITTGGLTSIGDEIVVAVVDGGVDINHPDLISNIWVNENEIPNNGIDDDGNGYVDDINGWDAYSNDGSIPSDNHGTHVAGTIGAKGNNNSDVVGVNWNVKIMSVAGSSGSTSTISLAYGYILDQKSLWLSSNGEFGANVVATNSSFGVDNANCNSGSYPVWNDLYDAMGQVGILSAAATTNSNQNVDQVGDVPTGCNSEWVISVTNTTRNDVKYNSAGYGANNIDLGAPGTDICSTVSGGVSCSYTGTSMATPHVAGAVGLMHAGASIAFAQDCINNPAACSLEIKNVLLNTVDILPSLDGITVSGGRLNLFNALQEISGPSPNLDFSPGEFTFQINQGDLENDILTLFNNGEDNSILSYQLKVSPFLAMNESDNYGNIWSDSETELFDYEWIDISEIGTLYSFPNNDDFGQELSLDFDFPFYGNNYNIIRINPNGWIGFGDNSNEWDNQQLPSNSAPSPAIFPFWDDLNPVNDNCNQYCSGNVYYHSNNDRIVVWFNNVAHWWTNFENSFYDFQVIMYSNGDIDFNYNEMIGDYSSATIGIQNFGAEDGLQVSYNNNYAESLLSIKIVQSPEWITLSQNFGQINAGESNQINITIDSNDLLLNEYLNYVNITSFGGNVNIPLYVFINEDVTFMGDLNFDEIINILDAVIMVNFITSEDEANNQVFESADLNIDGLINVLDIVLLVNIILG